MTTTEAMDAIRMARKLAKALSMVRNKGEEAQAAFEARQFKEAEKLARRQDAYRQASYNLVVKLKELV